MEKPGAGGARCTARSESHGGVEEERSHGGVGFNDTMEMSDGDRAAGGGDPGGVEQTDSPG